MNWFKNRLHPLHYKKKVIINGKSFYLEWTKRAEEALDEREKTLNIEMELVFSCLIKKFVNFHETYDESITSGIFHPITNKITVCFHPVISSICEVGKRQYQHKTVDVNLDNLNDYYPKRLSIDFKKGQWKGNFS